MKKIFLLEGNWVQRQEILTKIKSHVKDYELSTFDEYSNYNQLQQTMLEFSCFDNWKLIIINGIPKITAPNKTQARNKVLNNLKNILPKVPSLNIIVLNNLNIKSKSFINVIKKIGKAYIFDKSVKKSKGASWIVKYFEEKNKMINFEDANIIVESLEMNSQEINVDKINLMIKKIEHYIGNKNRIKKEDVVAVCSHSMNFVIWSLFNSFDDKNFCESMKLFNNLLSSSKNTEQEIIQLIYQVQWKYNLLLLAKNCIIKGMSQKDICDDLLKLNKMERTGKANRIKMNLLLDKDNPVPIYSEKMINSIFEGKWGNSPSLTCYKLKELLIINYAIKEYLTKIRVGCVHNELLISIKFLFMTICGMVKNKKTLRVLKPKNLVTLGEYYG